MANTCNVEEASGAMGSGRPIVLLKPKVPTSSPLQMPVSFSSLHPNLLPVPWHTLVNVVALFMSSARFMFATHLIT